MHFNSYKQAYNKIKAVREYKTSAFILQVSKLQTISCTNFATEANQVVLRQFYTAGILRVTRHQIYSTVKYQTTWKWFYTLPQDQVK